MKTIATWFVIGGVLTLSAGILGVGLQQAVHLKGWSEPLELALTLVLIFVGGGGLFATVIAAIKRIRDELFKQP